MFQTKSRKPSEKSKTDHGHSKRSRQSKRQHQVPQTLPYRSGNAPSQAQYPPGGNIGGGQIQQRLGYNYQEPPPPYYLSEDDNPRGGMQQMTSNSKEKPAISTSGWSKSDSFHRTNPFHSGSKQFPPASSHSVSDGCSDSGKSKGSMEKGMGPVSHPGAPHRHMSTRHPKNAPGYPSSTYETGQTRATPSVAGSRQHAGGDKHSEVGSDYSASTPRGPTPTPYEGTGPRSECFSAMSDSGYGSGATLRGVPNTGYPAYSQGAGYERSGDNCNMSVAGSETGCATESGSDISSVSTAETDDEERKNELREAFQAGYELGLQHAAQQWRNGRPDAQVHADQLWFGAYGGEKHGRWSTAVCNQLNTRR